MCVFGFTYVLMGDSCGDPLIVMFKTDQVAEDFLHDGGRERKRGRKRERERERERERRVMTWFVVIMLLLLQMANATV